MVTATFTSLLDFDTIDTYYADDALELRVERSQRAVYVDTESGNRIVLEGKNFSYNGDVLVGGTITDATFKGSEGGDFATITNANYDAESLAGILVNSGVQDMLRSAFKADDQLIGSAARDVLWGAAGDDTLRGRGAGDTLKGGKGDDLLNGGKGSDIFIFDNGDGSDRVLDFDAIGGGKDQDYIGVEAKDDFTIRRSGSDTVIDFGNDDIITLVGVHRSDVSHADFHLI